MDFPSRVARPDAAINLKPSAAPEGMTQEYRGRRMMPIPGSSLGRSAIYPDSAGPAPPPAYGLAPFISHLIATAAGLPQTRRRWRADPGRVLSAYAAASGAPTPAGSLLRQNR